MDWLKLIPIIFQIIGLIGPIRDALRSGESVWEVLKTKGPGIIQFIADIGKSLFPGLKPEDQVQAGALIAVDQDSVKLIQTALNKLLGAGLIVDGSYGKLTKAAVEKFQKANGLEVDGWAGKLTWAVMQVALAKLEAPAAMAKVQEAQAVVVTP